MKVGKILMIIGGSLAGLIVMGIFGGGAALIEAAFSESAGFIRVIGIVYIVAGVIGLILFIIGFFLNIEDTPSSQSSGNSTSKSDSKSYSYDEPVTQSKFYEYGTMRDEYGNEVNVTHNTVTDTYTDDAGNSYTSDGDYFYED